MYKTVSYNRTWPRQNHSSAPKGSCQVGPHRIHQTAAHRPALCKLQSASTPATRTPAASALTAPLTAVQTFDS